MGECVECLDSASCLAATPHCDGTSRSCKTCLVDGTGCASPNPTCDISQGTGVCIRCDADADCAQDMCMLGDSGDACVTSADCCAPLQCGGKRNRRTCR